nr:uncharacterized protein LOC109753470 [Aegilops tauschii subsp. strangulata]
MDNPGILDLSGEQFFGGERREVSTASCRQLLLDTDACGTGGAPFAGGSTEASGRCCKRLHGGWRPLRRRQCGDPPPSPAPFLARGDGRGPWPDLLLHNPHPRSPILAAGLSLPRRRRPLPPLHAPLLFIAHGGIRRGSDGSKACDPSVTTAPEPGQSRGRLCELSSELTIALLHLRCKVAAATQVPWPLSHSCHPSRPQGAVVVGILFDAGCIYSHDNGQQLGVHHRSSSVSSPLRH